eukprot:m.137159 g.137159  ORF g.137159 m.137159 type:complete len:207 (+) comp11333_c0_seq1:108-728(+)
MSSWFGKKTDPAEEKKKNNRLLKRNEREMEREIRSSDREEEKLKRDIKIAARKGDKVTANALAKQLVQTRKLKEKQFAAKSTIIGVKTKTKTMDSTANLARIMGNTTKVMTATNKQMDMQKMMKTLEQFNAESMKIDMSEELLDDAFESAFEDEGESDELLDQVFTEIGLDVTGQLKAVPNRTPVFDKADVVKAEEDDLLARLAAL